MSKRIYLCLAHMSGKEEAFIHEAFNTNWVVPLGPNVNGFEKDLEEFVGQENEYKTVVKGAVGGGCWVHSFGCFRRYGLSAQRQCGGNACGT